MLRSPGRTASGLSVGHGIAAVDPSVIPLGTRLYVPGYGDPATGMKLIGADGSKALYNTPFLVVAPRFGLQAIFLQQVGNGRGVNAIGRWRHIAPGIVRIADKSLVWIFRARQIGEKTLLSDLDPPIRCPIHR